MVNALDFVIVVKEFELQSQNTFTFKGIPWEEYDTPYPSNYGLNSTTTTLLEGWLLN